MKKNMLIPWILFISLISACTPIIDAPSTTIPSKAAIETSTQSPKIWGIVLIISGGLRGLQREAHLSFEGELNVLDIKTNNQLVTQISQEDLQLINELIQEFDFLETPGALPACADCIGYELDIQQGERCFQGIYNDISLGTTSAQPLINKLISLQEEALK
jgi:hypothetical protein